MPFFYEFLLLTAKTGTTQINEGNNTYIHTVVRITDLSLMSESNVFRHPDIKLNV